jgi:hypothetical protein
MTPAEARALNALRAENIRNNVLKLVDKALVGLPRGMHLPDADHTRVQEEITSYATQYQFAPKPPAKSKLNAYEQALEDLADARVAQANYGWLRMPLSAEAHEREMRLARALPELQERAREQVQAISAAAQRALAEL